jgi:hypothetical protein
LRVASSEGALHYHSVLRCNFQANVHLQRQPDFLQSIAGFVDPILACFLWRHQQVPGGYKAARMSLMRSHTIHTLGAVSCQGARVIGQLQLLVIPNRMAVIL